MRTLPLLTGVITVGLLGFVGWVLISQGAWLLGSLAIGFGIFRLVVFGIQGWRWLQSRSEEEVDEEPVQREALRTPRPAAERAADSEDAVPHAPDQ